MVSSGNNVTKGNRVSKQINEEDKAYCLNDTYNELTQVAVELGKADDGSFETDKYYTRGTELASVDINKDNIKKLYLMDGMDSYAGTLDNPVSLHKYLYANANPVVYIDLNYMCGDGCIRGSRSNCIHIELPVSYRRYSC